MFKIIELNKDHVLYNGLSSKELVWFRYTTTRRIKVRKTLDYSLPKAILLDGIEEKESEYILNYLKNNIELIKKMFDIQLEDDKHSLMVMLEGEEDFQSSLYAMYII